jgi:hypothetical protein
MVKFVVTVIAPKFIWGVECSAVFALSFFCIHPFSEQ